MEKNIIEIDKIAKYLLEAEEDHETIEEPPELPGEAEDVDEVEQIEDIPEEDTETSDVDEVVEPEEDDKYVLEDEVEVDEVVEDESVPKQEPQKPMSMPQQAAFEESDKNGVRRKKLYVEFIKWAQQYNPTNTFSSNFGPDTFNTTYPFVHSDLRYFYRLADPSLCVLSGKLTFFSLQELRRVNKSNNQFPNILIFAATDNDLRVFNSETRGVNLAKEVNGNITLDRLLANTFDLYIQALVGQGDILNAPLNEHVYLEMENSGLHPTLSPEEREIIKKRFGDIQCSIKKDKDGYYAYTHRARSKSYPSLLKLPKSKVLFISSTA